MANVKISDLTGAASASGTQEFEVNDSGTSKKVTGSQLATFIEGEVSSSPTLTGQVSLDNGTNTAPSLTNTGDTNTGLYFPSDDTVGLAAGGGLKLSANASGIDVTGTVTADGLTVDGAATLSGQLRLNNSNYWIDNSGGSDISYRSGGTHKFYSGGFNQRLNIASNGDISFYEDTGTTPKFFWDASAERLGIGTSSPDTLMEMVGTDAKLTIRDPSGSTAAALATLRLAESGASDTLGSYWDITAKDSAWQLAFTHSSAGEAMRIDSSGNLLVGKTTISTATVGHQLLSSGLATFTRDGGEVQVINRLTSDGDIVQFRKDGTTVGSIGTSGRPYFANNAGDSIMIGDNGVLPRNSTGGSQSGVINLGGENDKWKDLYLSGGVYLGGTGAANKLDDYEEGTWTPVLTSTSGTIAVQGAFNTLNYTKVGRVVTLTGRFRIGSMTGVSGFIAINLPFTAAANVEGSGFAALTLLTHGTALPAGTISTFAEVNPNSTEATFYAQKDNASWVAVDASGFANGDIVYVNGTYTTA